MSDYGFDFRETNTSPFTGDPANCSPVLSSVVGSGGYPTTFSNGATAGWTTSGMQVRDRNSSVDARLMGVHHHDATVWTFQIDLDAAESKTINLALGDATYGRSSMTCDLIDNATTFTTVSGATSAGSHWLDATSVERTSSNDWVTNNAAYTRTFGSTTFLLTGGNGVDETDIAHVRVTTTVAAGRASKNTHTNPLGMQVGMSSWITG